MKKEVIVSICGQQFADGESSEPVEVVSSGVRYEKNGKTYIVYDEVVSEGIEDSGEINLEGEAESENIVKNTIRIDGKQMDLIKHGEGGTHLVFEEGQSNHTYYHTPYGSMAVTLHTSKLAIKLDEESIDAVAEYDLEINHTQIAECMVTIRVK